MTFPLLCSLRLQLFHALLCSLMLQPSPSHTHAPPMLMLLHALPLSPLCSVRLQPLHALPCLLRFQPSPFYAYTLFCAPNPAKLSALLCMLHLVLSSSSSFVGEDQVMHLLLPLTLPPLFAIANFSFCAVYLVGFSANLAVPLTSSHLMAVRMLQIGGDPVVEIRDKAASALVPTLAYPEPISPRYVFFSCVLPAVQSD